MPKSLSLSHRQPAPPLSISPTKSSIRSQHRNGGVIALHIQSNSINKTNSPSTVQSSSPSPSPSSSPRAVDIPMKVKIGKLSSRSSSNKTKSKSLLSERGMELLKMLDASSNVVRMTSHRTSIGMMKTTRSKLGNKVKPSLNNSNNSNNNSATNNKISNTFVDSEVSRSSVKVKEVNEYESPLFETTRITSPSPSPTPANVSVNTISLTARKSKLHRHLYFDRTDFKQSPHPSSPSSSRDTDTDAADVTVNDNGDIVGEGIEGDDMSLFRLREESFNHPEGYTIQRTPPLSNSSSIYTADLPHKTWLTTSDIPPPAHRSKRKPRTSPNMKQTTLQLKVATHDLRLHSTYKWLSRRGKGASMKAEMTRVSMLRTWFNALDADGSGDISVDELLEPLTCIGLVENKDELTTMIAQFDSTGNGEIDFDEFIKMVLHTENDQNGEPNAMLKLFEDFNSGVLGDVILPFGVLVGIYGRRILLDEIMGSVGDKDAVNKGRRRRGGSSFGSGSVVSGSDGRKDK